MSECRIDAEALQRPRTRLVRWADLIMNSSLKPSTKVVAVALWTFTDKDGRNASPGYDALALMLGISRKTASRCLSELREGGWIVKAIAANDQPHREWFDVYDINIPEAAA